MVGARGRVGGPDGYTVGITVFVKPDGSLGLYENGLRQNVFFLFRLFQAAPGCRKVYLLNHGDTDPGPVPPELGLDAASIVRTDTVIDDLDYVISIGALMDRGTVAALRTRGCRIVGYKGGNGAVISMEAAASDPPRSDAERYLDHDYFDALWMTPQHIHTFKAWCETLYRCPVHEVPQVWSSFLIEQSAPRIADAFGYQPGVRPWRVGILDPNITVMKTSHMPMLVCEAAYRRDPDAFRAVYVSNGLRYRDNAHFKSFTASLTATKAGVMTVEPRFVGIQFLADHCDAVVTHHWENGLNYLFYEVLYGGYPLVHNSSFLRDYGYYYDDFDAESGAGALLRAVRDHDENLEAYRAKTAELMARLEPTAAHNIALHEGLLAAIGAHEPGKTP